MRNVTGFASSTKQSFASHRAQTGVWARGSTLLRFALDDRSRGNASLQQGSVRKGDHRSRFFYCLLVNSPKHLTLEARRKSERFIGQQMGAVAEIGLRCPVPQIEKRHVRGHAQSVQVIFHLGPSGGAVK